MQCLALIIANVLLCATSDAATTYAAGIPAPQASDCRKLTTTDSKDITLAIGEDAILWNGTLVRDMSDLLSRAKSISPIVLQPEALLCGDPEVNYEKFGYALMALQRAGIAKVGFVIGGEVVDSELPVTQILLSSRNRVVAVYIDIDGNIFWNGRLVPDSATLEQNFQSMTNNAAIQPVFNVHPNKQVAYKSVANVLALSHKSGAHNIYFVGNEAYLEGSGASASPTNTPAPSYALKNDTALVRPPVYAIRNDTSIMSSTVRASMDINGCKPAYPRASLMAEEQGTVRIQFAIDADGNLTDAAVVSSSGHPNLDNAALDSLSKCKFHPAYVDGKAINSSFTADWVWQLDK